MNVQQSDLIDPALVTEVDLARAAAQEEAGEERVGEYVSYHVEDEAAVTHLFEADKLGYGGWRWAVTVTSAGSSSDITVSEVVLLPGPSALVAPDWVPWQDRVQAGDLGVGDLLPTSPDDPRLVPAYAASDDPAVEETAMSLGLGRVRVMSRPARLEAADRWQQSEFGPRSDMARSAPAHCGTCGFYLPLAGSLQAAFGTCGNELSPADGHVVHAEYGCGAHSEAEVEQVSPVLVADLIYDDAQLDVESIEAPSPAAATELPAEPAVEPSVSAAEPVADLAGPVVVEPPAEVVEPAAGDVAESVAASVTEPVTVVEPAAAEVTEPVAAESAVAEPARLAEPVAVEPPAEMAEPAAEEPTTPESLPTDPATEDPVAGVPTETTVEATAEPPAATVEPFTAEPPTAAGPAEAPAGEPTEPPAVVDSAEAPAGEPITESPAAADPAEAPAGEPTTVAAPEEPTTAVAEPTTAPESTAPEPSIPEPSAPSAWAEPAPTEPAPTPTEVEPPVADAIPPAAQPATEPTPAVADPVGPAVDETVLESVEPAAASGDQPTPANEAPLVDEQAVEVVATEAQAPAEIEPLVTGETAPPDEQASRG